MQPTQETATKGKSGLVNTPFKRKKDATTGRERAIGIEMLDISEGETVYVEVLETGEFKSERFPEGIDFFQVIELSTGELKRMWVDGGLRGAFHTLGGWEKAKGLRLEITKGKQKALDVMNKQTGKMEAAKVNTYKVFELE